MNPWKRFRDEFEALMKKEDGIVQPGLGPDPCYAYVTIPDSGEFGGWVAGSTEGLRVGFELLATEAGIALGPPSGVLPKTYWLYRLFADLRTNESSFIRIDNNTGGFIERLFEASAIYCARLEQESLEKSAMPCENAVAVAAEPPRRGYRLEVRQWMEREGVPTLDLAAKHLHISLSALKSIMSERGKRRYAQAVLTRILENIRYKGE
jgi:hypothetical protein